MRAGRRISLFVCMLVAHSAFATAFADTTQEITNAQYSAFRSSAGVHEHTPHGIPFESSKKYLIQGQIIQGACVYSPNVPVDTAKLLTLEMEYLTVDLAFSTSTCQLAIEAGYIIKKTWKTIEDTRRKQNVSMQSIDETDIINPTKGIVGISDDFRTIESENTKSIAESNNASVQIPTAATANSALTSWNQYTEWNDGNFPLGHAEKPTVGRFAG